MSSWNDRPCLLSETELAELSASVEAVPAQDRTAHAVSMLRPVATLVAERMVARRVWIGDLHATETFDASIGALGLRVSTDEVAGLVAAAMTAQGCRNPYRKSPAPHPDSIGALLRAAMAA